MANSDNNFSVIEKENIVSILRRNFQLSDIYATELMTKADTALKESVDLWRFTNLINKNYSTTEKIKVVEMVWIVIYADGKLDKHEDYLIHQLSNLLRLTHKQLIGAKLRVLGKD